MESSKTWWPLAEHGDEFRLFMEANTRKFTDEAVQAVAAEVPELAGPDPRLRELLALLIHGGLENFTAVVAYQIPAATSFEPPAAIEHARVLAQRGVPANSILLGYQVMQRSLTNPIIEAVARFVEDRDELIRTVESVLAHLYTQVNNGSRAALRTHASTHDAWLRGRGAGLSQRLDAILNRNVSDARQAERALNYVISGKHVAFIAWLDDPERPLDMAEAESRVAKMKGLRDTLLVPRDERTLYAWLHPSGQPDIEQWMSVALGVEDSRIAFGETAVGLDGFRISHMQAQAAGAVIRAARKMENPMVVRYRDVAPLTFLVEKPAESKAWASQVLGGLSGPGEELERIRETLQVFLEEGENAVATGERLFIHRNTVRYRIDRALSLLPRPIDDRRLDVALALKYVDWVAEPTQSNADSSVDAHA